MSDVAETAPRSSPASATVRPPIRWVARSVGREPGEQRPHLVDERPAHRVLGGHELDQPQPRLVAGRQRLGQQVRQQEHLDAAGAHLGDELVVLLLGPLDPQHVVEEQLVVVRRASAAAG